MAYLMSINQIDCSVLTLCLICSQLFANLIVIAASLNWTVIVWRRIASQQATYAVTLRSKVIA